MFVSTFDDFELVVVHDLFELKLVSIIAVEDTLVKASFQDTGLFWKTLFKTD